MNSLRRFIRDEAGFLSSLDYIMMVTLVVLGSIVGLATVRDHIVQQFGDISVAMESISQSYSVTVAIKTGDTFTSTFTDSNSLTDPVGQEPAGISVTEPATSE